MQISSTSWVWFFFYLSTHFFIQKPIKHSKHFDKLVYDHKKKIKNNSKNQNQTEAKMIHLVRSTSLCKEKEKKYLDQTPLMKRNLLTLKSTILVVRIVVNDEFIFLCWNPTSPSLFSIKKEQKKRREKNRI